MEAVLLNIAEETGLNPQEILERWAAEPFYRIQDIYRIRNELGELERFKAYPYVVKFIHDAYAYPNTDQVVLKSRQIGFSTAFEILSPDMALMFDAVEISIVAQKYETAKKALRKIGMFIKDSPYFDALPITKGAIQKEMIEFENGSRIIPYPATPESLRSDNIKKAFMDEFAFVQDQRGMIDAIEPKVTRGGSIAYISTPLSNDDEFMKKYEAASSGKDPYTIAYYYPMFAPNSIDPNVSLFDQPVERLCVDARLDRIEKVRLDSVERFLQEYMCTPLDDSLAYYPTSLILSTTQHPALIDMMYAEALDHKHRPGIVRFGIDHAMVRDETAVVAIYDRYGTHFMIDMIRMQGDFDLQLDRIDDMVRKLRPSSIRVDNTGEMGAHVESKLKDMYGYIVDGVYYTNAAKREMAVRLKRFMQNTANKTVPYIHILSDEDVISQLHGIKVEQTNTGLIKFSGKGGGALDDIVNAIWLSLPEIDPEPSGTAVTEDNPLYTTNPILRKCIKSRGQFIGNNGHSVVSVTAGSRYPRSSKESIIARRY